MNEIGALIEAIHAAGATITANGRDLVLTPASTVPRELKDRIRAHKPELLAALRPDLSELEASRKRLECDSISIAIQDDGTARILQADGRLANGETRYEPREMQLYVSLTQRDRRMLHDFKKRFGGNVEWRQG